MSIQSIMSVHRCTILNYTESAGSSGGLVRTLSDTRVDIPCRVKPASSNKSDRFEKHGQELDYTVYFPSNPAPITEGDRIKFTDENGVVRTLVVKARYNPHQLDYFWKVDCMESTAVENRS